MGRPTGVQAGQPATVSRITEAALELFYERGYHGTSVRDVAVACGLTTGAMYNHFGSKDALLFAVIKAGHVELDAEIDAAMSSDAATATDLLHRLAYATTLYNARAYRLARIANDEYRYLSGPELAEILTIRRRVRSRFEDVIRRGIGTGEFAAPVELLDEHVRITTMAVLNHIVGITRWFRPEGDLTAEEVAGLYADLGVAMVRGRRP